MDNYIKSGFWRRFIALVYDVFIIISILLGGFAILYIILLLILGEQAVNVYYVLWHWGWALVIKIYLLGLWFGYYALSWIKGGQTLGMKPWRLYVVDIEGKPLNIKNSAIRFFSGFLGLGLVMIPFNEKKLALHDLLSKTVTVTKER